MVCQSDPATVDTGNDVSGCLKRRSGDDDAVSLGGQVGDRELWQGLSLFYGGLWFFQSTEYEFPGGAVNVFYNAEGLNCEVVFDFTDIVKNQLLVGWNRFQIANGAFSRGNSLRSFYGMRTGEISLAHVEDCVRGNGLIREFSEV